jgi:hypothetical protein
MGARELSSLMDEEFGEGFDIVSMEDEEEEYDLSSEAEDEYDEDEEE